MFRIVISYAADPVCMVLYEINNLSVFVSFEARLTGCCMSAQIEKIVSAKNIK